MISTGYTSLRQLGNKNFIAIMQFFAKRARATQYVTVETEYRANLVDINPAFRNTRQLTTNASEVRRVDSAESSPKNESNLVANEISADIVKSLSSCKLNGVIDEISRPDDMDDVEMAERLPKPLDICTEDLSHMHGKHTNSYNIAKYANESYVIQELIKLGVKVYKLDMDTALAEFYLTRNFDKDVKPYIQFLHDNGVPADELGNVLSRNLYLLQSDLDDLHNRVNYMKSKSFTNEMITAMIVKSPQWLCKRIEVMDGILGYIQNAIKASGNEMRTITTLNPSILTRSKFEFSNQMFSLMREMGFSVQDVKKMIVMEPAILTNERHKLIETFDYLYNEMQLSHEVIVQQPRTILFRRDRIQTRHLFLKALGRVQYDSKKPLYICPLTFIRVSDEEFCNTICRCSTEIFYQFVKLM